MRSKSALLVLSLFSYFMSHSQSKEQPQKSKLESFSEKSGILMQKTFLDIGKLNSLVIQVLTFENLTDHSKISGLRLEGSVYSSLGSDTKTAFLDKDEIDGLITALKYFTEKIFLSTPESYTETGFTSRTGFSATAFQDNKKKWSVAIKLEKYDSRSTIYLKESDIGELTALIEKAKSQLQ